MYPAFRKCTVLRVDLNHYFRSNVKSSSGKYSSCSIPNVSRLIDMHKLHSHSVKNKIASGELHRVGNIPSNKLENVCKVNNEHECTAINFYAENDIVDKHCSICFPYQKQKMSHSQILQMDKSLESIYNANTFFIATDIKQKLSWIRYMEYSHYAKELMNKDKIKSVKNELLTVATYNVLSQDLLEKHNYLYSSHDQTSLCWKTRCEILLEEFALLDADILCLQEIDSYMVEPFYDKYLTPRDYEGVYKKRTHGKIDGCAIYFKKNKFNLVRSKGVEFYMESVRLLSRDNIGIVLKLSLKDRPHVELVVATTHLLYNPKRGDIKLAQTQVMLAEIEKLAYKGVNQATGEAEYLPIIFMGDMNYTPDSGVYQLVTRSHLKYEGMSRKYLLPLDDDFVLNKTLLPAKVGVTDSCQYASTLSDRSSASKVRFESGTLNHHLNLASVYGHTKKDLPEATTNQDKWLTVDYIFYSQAFDHDEKLRADGNLKLFSKLALPNESEAERELRNIPNLACGSDHLPLMATFHLTDSIS